MLTPLQRKRLAKWLIAGLVVALLIDLSFLVPVYGEICSKNEYTYAKDCTREHLVTVALWQFLKILDASSVVITALATVVIGCFTFTLWTTSQNQLHHARKTERAYLAGGGDCRRDKTEQPIIIMGKKQFRMALGNQGRTPAYLFAYELKFCTQRDVKGSRPDLPKCVHKDQYPPGQKDRHVKDFPIVPDRADVVYGAFHYRDIWHREWYSRFILRIDKTDWHTYADLDVDESWTKWT